MSEIIWKPIVAFPDYAVSNTGQVKRIKFSPFARGNNELRPQKISIGYLRVILFRDSIRHYQYVHQLVLTAFAGNPPNGYVCNHKNGNKHDNRIENLEWLTRGDNVRHAIKVLHVRRASKVTAEQVREIRKLYASKRYNQKQLGEMYGVDGSAISYIVTRRNWAHIE